MNHRTHRETSQLLGRANLLFNGLAVVLQLVLPLHVVTYLSFAGTMNLDMQAPIRIHSARRLVLTPSQTVLLNRVCTILRHNGEPLRRSPTRERVLVVIITVQTPDSIAETTDIKHRGVQLIVKLSVVTHSLNFLVVLSGHAGNGRILTAYQVRHLKRHQPLIVEKGRERDNFLKVTNDLRDLLSALHEHVNRKLRNTVTGTKHGVSKMVAVEKCCILQVPS